ncbi:glutaredoxin-like protein NrdH [Mycobacterium sp. TY815]|uniref:glutaredoxin-like protein NrdH n=1 Tax=Mycobacterium sp. TY815 TaxID=3050581 RepID=UPI0027418713|nr:glutaredoxin-like protein NrdH [Mycobacterium sp. TY815]MDP7707501.1 glutaredoxin-like protein NrdH [Mycobacterium sp. TY815]
MSVILYTKPNCPQCDATKRALTKNGIIHHVIDATADPAARESVMALGYSQVPVVVAGNRHWSGFRPDRIKALADAVVPSVHPVSA